MQDMIYNLILDSFNGADYHTQIFICFVLFTIGLVFCMGFFLMAHYSEGFFKHVWRVVGLGVLGCFCYMAGAGAITGFQNYRVAKVEMVKDARIRQEAEKQKYELMKAKQAEDRQKQMEKEAMEEVQRQLNGGEGVISALDFANGKGAYLQRAAANEAQAANQANDDPDMIDDDDFLRGKGSLAASGAKQELSRVLRDVETGLREQLRDVNKQISEADTAYKSGSISTYQQLLSKAQLEQAKQELIISAMDEKISIINNAELSYEDKEAVMEAAQKRRTAAMAEKGQYAEVEQVLISRKDEYEAL